MGEVVPFKIKPNPQTIADRYSGMSQRMATNAAMLDRARDRLLFAGACGERAMQHLNACCEQLDWLAEFRARCLAATELTDLSEMERLRDELSETRRRRLAGGACERSIAAS
jgi:hypothetical protein